MARGWDSKSVEEQIQAANARTGVQRVRLTAEQIEVERKRDGLLLQRTRVLRELSACTNDRHKQTIESGLAYLEEQLTGLGWTRPVG